MRTHKTFVDNKLESETPYSVTEEISADAGDYFKQLTKDILGGDPLPTTYEDFKARYNPQAAFEAELTRQGVDPKTISPDVMKLGALFMHFGYQATIFMHGTPPSMPKQG